MKQEIARVLDAVQNASTAGAALDSIPEDWGMFVTGPENGEYSCSMMPAGDEGVTSRIYNQGLAMGRGVSRLQAMTKAVDWIRRRAPALAA